MEEEGYHGEQDMEEEEEGMIREGERERGGTARSDEGGGRVRGREEEGGNGGDEEGGRKTDDEREESQESQDAAKVIAVLGPAPALSRAGGFGWTWFGAGLIASRPRPAWPQDLEAELVQICRSERIKRKRGGIGIARIARGADHPRSSKVEIASTTIGSVPRFCS